MSAISLSNDTVHRRIDDMSADILDQLDESTDVANCSQLLVYIGILMMATLKMSFFFANLLKRQLLHSIRSLGKRFLVFASDGAPAMLGCRSGFQRLVLNESPKVIGTHCMIHRQILAMKTLPQDYKK
ncbi:hypothetical protein QTO34_004168 [Cnephaeus nilssonii]|uniref:Uncharacterized protein n=1 Tax=Cnephaeus nilssonii TaxID=3371016 RepID=A0AA40LLC4_CNENI|nr:hypothetical protein QTO34_004168 [Eptesicus nilssonii]